MKSFTKTSTRAWLLALCIVSFSITACEKLNWFHHDEDHDNENIKKIHVANLDQLYAAINDPANTDSKIVLAPGTYLLSAGYPHGGRLELEYNMSLAGQPGHPEAVIIDVTNLPASSLVVPPTPTYPATLRTGAVRMGNGHNAVEWMTLQNDPNHNIRSLLQTDLVTTATTQVRIAHTIVKGGNIGINIQNRDAVSNGRIIEAEIEDNDVSGNIISPLGSGIQIQNSQAVTGAIILAQLKGNYIHGNRAGIAAFNASSIQSRIEIKSYTDRIEDNGVGLSLMGGYSENANLPTKDNFTLFEAYNSVVQNNSGTPQPPSIYLPGGLFAAGGIVPATTIPGTVNNNKLQVNLRDCSFKDNTGPFSINAFGAFSAYVSATPPGSGNIATINLIGSGKTTTANTVASYPAEPAGTNIVNLTRQKK